MLLAAEDVEVELRRGVHRAAAQEHVLGDRRQLAVWADRHVRQLARAVAADALADQEAALQVEQLREPRSR